MKLRRITLSGLKSLVLTDWPMKLTALALATVLWAAVAAEEPTTQLVPVTLRVDPPEGRALTRPLPQVKALYSGTARELIKLYASPPLITAIIPDTVMGSTYSLALSPADLKLVDDANVKAQDVQPRHVEVTLDEVARRRVPVISRVAVRPDSGFAIVGGVVLDPSSLLVRGPEAIVKRINSVSTVPLEITDVKSPVDRSVLIDTSGMALVQLVPREVAISADVQPMSERVLTDVRVTVRATRGAWVSDPATVLLALRGPTSRVMRLTPDSIQVLALPNGNSRRQTVGLSVVAPQGIEAAATPDTVRVERRQ